MDDAATIVAVASAPGRAGRGVVRLAGDGTRGVLGRVLTGPVPTGAGAHRARVRLGDCELPVLLAAWRGPRSYTGSDAAEILAPGNPDLLGRIVDACVDAGAERAGPGAFSARAFLAGKITLDQAEGVAATISAETDADLRAARELTEGRAGDRARAWADEIARLLALVEAGIDFTDQEDVVAIAPADLHASAATIAGAIDRLGVDAAREETGDDPLVVLVGPPNAGKSTLFNALLGRPRAVIADEPGTTRDALIETLDLSPHCPGAGRVRLADLPGLSDAPIDALDAQAQRAARGLIARAHALVLCDPAGRFEFAADGVPAVRVRTKGDLPGGGAADAITVCAIDGMNLGALCRAIADASGARAHGSASAASARHGRALAAARDHLTGLLGVVDPEARALNEPEVAAAALRAALDAVGEIVGHITPDDVIGRVFATFCVGK
ncbi:MAG: GTPase [Phycisphaerales bacterium]